MHVEQALIDPLGDVGGKLHTAAAETTRSPPTYAPGTLGHRPDRAGPHRPASAFVDRCDADADVILPGYTHFQRAQPVLAPHYWLAYCEKFQRDRFAAGRLPPPCECASARHRCPGGHKLPIGFMIIHIATDNGCTFARSHLFFLLLSGIFGRKLSLKLILRFQKDTIVNLKISGGLLRKRMQGSSARR